MPATPPATATKPRPAPRAETGDVIGQRTDVTHASGVERILAVAAASAAVLALWWALAWASAKYSTLDGAYALLWIADPTPYTVTATHFGHLYHPLWWITGGDVAGIRRLNILLTFAVSSSAVWVALGSLPSRGSWPRWLRLAVALGLGSTGLLIFNFGEGAANYNSLAFQGVVVSGLGLLLLSTPRSRRAVIAASGLVGLGGWLAFMGKPTTAAVLAVIVALIFLGTRASAWAWLGAAGGSAFLLLVTAWTLEGGIRDFARRFTRELAAQHDYGAGHTIGEAFRIDQPGVAGAEWWVLVGLLALGALAWLVARGDRGPALAGALVVAVPAMTLAAVTGWVHVSEVLNLGESRALCALAASLGALGAAAFAGRSGRPWRFSPSSGVLGAGLVLLPFAVAAGTNTNMWRLVSGSVLLAILGAALLLLGPHVRYQDARLALLVIAVLGASFTALLRTETRLSYLPYSERPIKARSAAITHGGAELQVPVWLADYMDDLGTGAAEAGFTAGTPVIDLTGRSPGTLVRLGASPFGRPWIPANRRRNSDAFARHYYRRETCERLAAAWVLAPAGATRPRQPLSPELLSELGAAFPAHYELRTKLLIPDMSVIKSIVDSALYAPVRPAGEAERECERARGR